MWVPDNREFPANNVKYPVKGRLPFYGVTINTFGRFRLQSFRKLPRKFFSRNFSRFPANMEISNEWRSGTGHIVIP